MWKISKMLAVLFVIGIGGFIGYVNTNSTNLQATMITGIRWVDVPKTDVSFPGFVKIDLQEDRVSFSGNTENATVIVKKEIEKVPVYVEKEVIKTKYEPDYRLGNKLLDIVAPLQLPKINVDRKQSSKTVYKGYKL